MNDQKDHPRWTQEDSAAQDERQAAFFAKLGIPEMSDWKCYLFGSSTLTFRPLKGNEPNAWWRFWQWALLGNRWVQDD